MSETNMEVKSGLGDHILFLSKVGLSKFCYRSENMAERKFRWDCENSLCHSEIHCSPMLDPAATVPLATIPCILHPASCIWQLSIFFSYFLPALKFIIPGLLNLI